MTKLLAMVSEAGLSVIDLADQQKLTVTGLAHLRETELVETGFEKLSLRKS